MKSFKVIMQHDAMDCGAACLAMITCYYGKNYQVSTLREKTYISKEGVSLLGISDAAENIGFKTLGGRFTIEKIKKEAPLPCIVHWKQQHFIVLYKITTSRVLVADPAQGLVNYSYEEFNDGWLSTRSKNYDKGVALLLEPTPQFFQKVIPQKQIKSISFLFSYIKRYKRFFIQLILGLILVSVIQLIFPFLTQATVDVGIKNKDINFIYLILLAQLALFVGQFSVDMVRRWILLHISTRINLSLLSDFFIKLMHLPMSWFESRLVGDITQRVADHSRVENFLTVQSLSTVFSIVTFFVFGVVLFNYSTLIFLVFVISTILYVGWIMLFLKKRKVLDYEYFAQRAEADSKTFQLITGMQEIKLQNCEKLKRWDWEDVQANLFKVNVKSLILEQYQGIGNFFIEEVKNILITIIAATSVINGSITLGMMLAIEYIIGQLNSPVKQVVAFIYDWQDMKISLDRINEVHGQLNENYNRSKIPEEYNKDLIVSDLSFSYDGSPYNYVLQNINITIPYGQTTAIVGGSGSGKTTLIKLLLQYYNPTHGEVFLDQQNLLEVEPTWWRSKCGSVMQDGFIFSDTIANNIAINDETPDLQKLHDAIKMANLTDTIDMMPLKHNTQIGVEGNGLSRGQIQRILIARAFYKNPEFLFFDEATNALDAINESVIVENIAKFFNNKTLVVVAHRLSTVRNANKIIVIDKGRVVEEGNHKSLSQKKGVYYKLVKNQLELGS